MTNNRNTIWKNTSRAIFLLLLSMVLTSCSQQEQKTFDIKHVWKLSQVVYYGEEVADYSQSDITWLRIYDDSCYYVCQMIQAPNGLMFVPSSMDSYTLIDKGHGEFLYLHGDDNHPLTIDGDSVMTTQENGVLYVWKVTDELDSDKVKTITGIVRNEVNSQTDSSNRYVLSYAERDLEETNHTLIYSLILGALVLLGILNYVYLLRRDKKRVEQTLRQIEEEHQSIPTPVREAMHSVEDEFHSSQFYITLHRRIAAGERLGDQDYIDIEEHFRSVYPRFCSTLFSLVKMSEVEYRVCLLLKLNASPSEIASVLCRDKSSISTVRSRLYSKVFDRKGSSRDWDEFVMSL